MTHADPMPDPAALLARLEARLGDLQALRREVAGLWRDLHAFGGTLPVSGYAPDEWLGLVGRLCGFDTRRLQTFATRLPALPDTDRALWDGTITVDQAGWICDATRRLSGHALSEADVAAVALAQDVNRRGDDPDIRPALDRLVRDLRPEVSVDRMERRRETGQRLIAQQDLDGGGWLYAELDPAGFTTTVRAIDHAAGPPTPDLPRRTQRAAGLTALASHWLASPMHGRARSAVVVHVDLTDATINTAGTILRSTPGGQPGLLSARAVETIACDADLTVQLTDGTSPLARLKDQTTLPDQVRAAVLDRDGGCRWPSCTAPVWHCDVHHLTRGPTVAHTIPTTCSRCAVVITGGSTAPTGTPSSTRPRASWHCTNADRADPPTPRTPTTGDDVPPWTRHRAGRRRRAPPDPEQTPPRRLQGRRPAPPPPTPTTVAVTSHPKWARPADPGHGRG